MPVRELKLSLDTSALRDQPLASPRQSFLTTQLTSRSARSLSHAQGQRFPGSE
jgi:hypothetical protein